MSPTQPFAAKPAPEPTQPAPFTRAINAMLGYGMNLLARLQAAVTHNDTSQIPRRFARAPVSAEARTARTLDWIFALARTLVGDRHWLRTPTYLFPSHAYRAPPLTAKLREEIGLPALPPRTEAQKAAAHLWYVRKVFATQPTNKIAARLARRLGIEQASDFWPRELLTITQTPAAYAAAQPKPRPHPPTPEPQQAPLTATAVPPPTATGPPGNPTASPATQAPRTNGVRGIAKLRPKKARPPFLQKRCKKLLHSRSPRSGHVVSYGRSAFRRRCR